MLPFAKMTTLFLLFRFRNLAERNRLYHFCGFFAIGDKRERTGLWYFCLYVFEEKARFFARRNDNDGDTCGTLMWNVGGECVWVHRFNIALNPIGLFR